MEGRNGVSITDKVVVYQKKISVLKNFRILDCQLNEKREKMQYLFLRNFDK